MKDCIFCKVGKGEVSNNRIYENNDFVAFLDINPLNKGHTLVIPKKHYRWVWDVPEFGKYFEAVKKIEKGIEKALKPLRVVMGVAGEEVEHAHVHLVPRFKEDGHGGFIKPENHKEVTKEEMKKIAEKVRNNI